MTLLAKTILQTPEDVASYGAQQLFELARTAHQQNHMAYVALSGGSTPKLMYTALLGPEFADLAWEHLTFFVGDERIVPLDHDWSNGGLALRELFIKLSQLPAFNPVSTNLAGLDAAKQYQDTIVQTVPLQNGIPEFDLIVLGLGSDRHTASLFPGGSAVLENKALVVSTEPGILPPPVDRVTFTLPLINNAKKVLILAAGEDKAEAVQDLVTFHSKPTSEAMHIPGALVRPTTGSVELCLDDAAATLIVDTETA